MNELPYGWHAVKIQELTTRTKQRDPSKNPDKPFRYVDVSSVNNMLFKIETVTNMLGAEAPSRARKEIKANDVLFATVRPTLKRIALVPQELDGEIASTGYCVLRPQSDKVVPEFLYHSLLTNNFIKAMGALERGVSYPAIRDMDVFTASISLPPLPEQRRIAHILSTVQTAIEQQERLITLTRELKSAVMHKLFTEGLRGEEQKKTEVGWMPESWKIGKLESIVIDAPVVNMRQENDRVIKYIDVSSISRETLQVQSTTRYILKDAPGRARKKVVKGDVIFATVRPTLLRVAHINDDLDNEICSTAFCVLRSQKSESSKFIYYALQREQFISQLAKIESGASYPAVTDRQVKSQLIPLPDIGEQLEIGEILNSVDLKITLIIQKRDTLTELFRTLLHQLMTGQIRVNEIDLMDFSKDEVIK